MIRLCRMHGPAQSVGTLPIKRHLASGPDPVLITALTPSFVSSKLLALAAAPSERHAHLRAVCMLTCTGCCAGKRSRKPRRPRGHRMTIEPELLQRPQLPWQASCAAPRTLCVVAAKCSSTGRCSWACGPSVTTTAPWQEACARLCRCSGASAGKALLPCTVAFDRPALQQKARCGSRQLATGAFLQTVTRLN